MTDTLPEDRETASRLALEGLRAQDRGAQAEAERSLDAGMQLDPDAVAEVLRETGADTAPDSRDSSTDSATDIHDTKLLPSA